MDLAVEQQSQRPLVLEGFIDGIDDTFICGWLRCRSRPAERVMVSFFENDNKVAQSLACEFRKDLADTGHGDGRYGFRIAVPGHLLDGGEHTLKVIAELNGVSQEFGSPVTMRLDPEPGVLVTQKGPDTAPVPPEQLPPATLDLEGYIDEVDDAFNVCGWVRCRDRPDQPVKLIFFEGKNAVAEQIACHFREDLADAGNGDGNWGFRVALPGHLLDGRDHHLTLIAELDGVTQKFAAPLFIMRDRKADAPVAKMSASPPVPLEELSWRARGLYQQLWRKLKARA